MSAVHLPPRGLGGYSLLFVFALCAVYCVSNEEASSASVYVVFQDQSFFSSKSHLKRDDVSVALAVARSGTDYPCESNQVGAHIPSSQERIQSCNGQEVLVSVWLTRECRVALLRRRCPESEPGKCHSRHQHHGQKLTARNNIGMKHQEFLRLIHHWKRRCSSGNVGRIPPQTTKTKCGWMLQR